MRGESGLNEGAIAMIRHGFSDALLSQGDLNGAFVDRCLSFTVQFYVGTQDGFHDLWSALHQVKYYNDFSAGRVIAVFRALEDRNGVIPGVSRIRFGREYSPVMYIDCDTKDRAKKLKDCFDYARPDEVDRTGKTIRLWWG
jgi:hypothetical protein